MSWRQAINSCSSLVLISPLKYWNKTDPLLGSVWHTSWSDNVLNSISPQYFTMNIFIHSIIHLYGNDPGPTIIGDSWFQPVNRRTKKREMGISSEVVIQVEFRINNWCHWCPLDHATGSSADTKQAMFNNSDLNGLGTLIVLWCCQIVFVEIAD